MASRLALLVVSVVLALLASELLIRIAAPRQLYRFPQGMFTDDAELGYTLTPGFVGVIDAEEYTTEIRINRQGLRADREFGRKPDGALRVIALGDSFTNAYAVSHEDSYPRRLERHLARAMGSDVEVVNAGFPGYAPWQEQIYLRDRGLALDPDLIVVGLFVGNDVTSNNRRVARVGVTDGYLTTRQQFDGFLPTELRAFLSRRSQLYNFLWPIHQTLRWGRRSTEIARSVRKFRVDVPGVSQEELDATLEVIEEIVTAGRSVDAGTLVALFPDSMQIYEDAWQAAIRAGGEPDGEYDPFAIHGRLMAAMAERGIPALDLAPAFLGAANGKGDELYFSLDHHWTPEGNELAARVIAEHLLASGLVGPADHPSHR